MHPQFFKEISCPISRIANAEFFNMDAYLPGCIGFSSPDRIKDPGFLFPGEEFGWLHY
jgi:hypothetical protein